MAESRDTLTIMDYEKEYNEALKRAKELSDAGNALTKLQLGIVFPELALSREEKIRNELIYFLEMESSQCSIEEHKSQLKEYIYWLEGLNLDAQPKGYNSI